MFIKHQRTAPWVNGATTLASPVTGRKRPHVSLEGERPHVEYADRWCQRLRRSGAHGLPESPPTHEHNRFSGFSAKCRCRKVTFRSPSPVEGIVDLPLQPLTDVAKAAQGIDVVFLATAHEVSHDIAPAFTAAGCVVFDLSGAFRVQDAGFIASTTVSHISMAPCWSRRYTARRSGRATRSNRRS